MSFIIKNWKFFVGAGGLMVVLLAIWYYGHTQYKRGKHDCEVAYTVALAEQKESAQKEIVKIQGRYDKIKAELQGTDAVCGPGVAGALERLRDLHNRQ